jgi:hypothetical protein
MSPAASDDDDAPAKGSGDFLRFYVIVMALMAAVLGWFWRKTEAEADDYKLANERARAVFGTERVDATVADEATPKTIRGLAVGVLKYLATNRDAGKTEGGINIPVETIKARATGAGMQFNNIGPERVEKNTPKRYEEVSVTVTFDPTNLDALAHFLYAVEQSSPIFRILDFSWELKPDKENPYVPGSSPGHLIGRPKVKIGFRRPLTASR